MKYIVPVILLMVSFLIPGAVFADTSIDVVDSSVEIFFPSGLVFNIECTSSADISRIRLQYHIERLNYAEVINEAWPELSPGTHIDTSWTWDMRRGSLPPGAKVSYWWIIENSAGEVVTTTPDEVVFRDLRYQWEEIQSDFLTLYWYDRSESFAQSLLDAADDALNRLADDTGARLEKPVDIYIYASSQDLQGSMIFPNEWTGGVAFTEYSTIAIGVSEQNLDWGKDAVAHELGHMVTHQITFSPYGETLPTWLDEGLAMHAESTVNEHYTAALKAAAASGKLISLQSLSSPFSARSMEAYLSYAESQSVVDYLIETHGKEKMLQLLHLYKDGETTDNALEITYGFNQKELNDSWQNSLISSTPGLNNEPYSSPGLDNNTDGAPGLNNNTEPSPDLNGNANTGLPLQILIIVTILVLLIITMIIVSIIIFVNHRKNA